MGDPRKPRKKYQTPTHPYQKVRIESERALKRDYALKNKTEIWRMNSIARNFAFHTRRLIHLTSPQAEVEREQILNKMKRLGLLKPESQIEDALGITVNDVMERRLQVQLYRKELARSMKQARQFITHGHVIVNGRVITSPSYLVSIDEESKISFKDASPFADSEHPERVILEVPVVEKTEDESQAKSNTESIANSETKNIISEKESELKAEVAVKVAVTQSDEDKHKNNKNEELAGKESSVPSINPVRPSSEKASDEKNDAQDVQAEAVKTTEVKEVNDADEHGDGDV